MSQRAILHVRVPADARLMVDGKPTQQTGTLRHFYSPPLEAGKSYHYTFEWTYLKDGKSTKDKKVIYVRAGDDKEEDLRDLPPKRSTARDDEAAEKKTEKKKPAREPDVIYLPTPTEVVDKMLEMAEVKKSDVLYDLGCGDGRIVIAAAKKYKCKAVGIEIDPELVEKARANVKAEKLDGLVEIREGDLFKADLKPASVVTMYLLDSLNAKLVPKLKELKPGSRIVSHDFGIEGYPPQKKESVTLKSGESSANVFMWVTPLEKK
jgi:uncharacterized protein (TIGR03000 family)